MCELKRIYDRYSKGVSLVSGRKYTIGKWYAGYRFVVLTGNVPVLAVKEDGSSEVIRPLGEKVLMQLHKLNIA